MWTPESESMTDRQTGFDVSADSGRLEVSFTRNWSRQSLTCSIKKKKKGRDAFEKKAGPVVIRGSPSPELACLAPLQKHASACISLRISAEYIKSFPFNAQSVVCESEDASYSL